MCRLASVASIFLIASLIPSAARAADDCPAGTVPSPGGPAGTICIPAADDSSGGGGGGGGDDGSGGGGEDPACDSSLADPQPPATSPWWGGHAPDDGDLYIVVCPGTGNPTYTFVPNDNPPPNPADLARRALGVLKLTRPDVHLAPKPPAKTYVGLETWLWMPAGQFSPRKKSVTAGDTTVTVTAVPESATWDMGPGSKTCYSAGREWKFGKMPKGSKTSCSYEYEKISDFEPGDKFKVSSTILYQVDWTCSGECTIDEGTLGQVSGPAGGASIRVSERQSVVVGGTN